MMAKKRPRGEDVKPDPLIPLIHQARRQLERYPPGGPLGWLVDFARSDPATWLPGDRDAHGHRLLGLIYPLPENQVRLGSGPIPPITPADVEAFHDELYDFFHRLVTVDAGALVEIPTDGLVEVIVRASARSSETLTLDGIAGPAAVPAIFGVSRGGPRKTMLYQEIKQLVIASDRLMSCPRCHRPFLALRKKKFCDKDCLREWHDKMKKNGGTQ
jgi:hypothetical protein